MKNNILQRIMCLSIAILLLSLHITSYAQSSNSKIVNIEYFDDGSRLVTEITEQSSLTRASSSKTGNKTFTYEDSNGNAEWSITLKGTFTYTGSSATCTSSSVSYNIYDSSWKCTSATAAKSGRNAKGSFTMKKYFGIIVSKTIEKDMNISCSNSGTLS
ncbi:MAG: hypothetical protein ACI4RR_00895 [Eubacterium sp.]